MVVVFPSPRGVGVIAETTTYLAGGSSESSPIASSFILATAAVAPGGARSSHSPGPEPTMRVPCSSRAARPKGTPRVRATSPSVDALTRTLASGVQSMIRRSAPLRRALISHPCSTVTGGAGEIGLRATGVASATLTHPLGIEVGVMLHDPGGDAFPVGQVHRHCSSRSGEVWGDHP